MTSWLLYNMNESGLKVNLCELFMSGIKSRTFFGSTQYFFNAVKVNNGLPFGGYSPLNYPFNNNGSQARKIKIVPIVFP